MTNMKTLRPFVLAAVAAAASACGGSTFTINGGGGFNNGSLGMIGVNPATPNFASTLARQLNSRGYSTVDGRTMEALVSSLDRGASFGLQVDVTQDPRLMAELAKHKIDVILASTEERVQQGFTTGMILTAHIRLIGTKDGASSEMTWQNSWGGMPGSPADGSMRKNDDAAAAEIVEHLIPLLGPPGPRQTVNIAELLSKPRQRRDRDSDRDEDAAPARGRGEGSSSDKAWWKQDAEPSPRQAKSAEPTDEPAPEQAPAPAPQPAPVYK